SFEFDHDWYVLFQEPLDYTACDYCVEHFWWRYQVVSCDLPTDQGIALCRSSACVWRREYTDHHAIFGAAHCATFNSTVGHLDTILCVSGSIVDDRWLG